MELTSRGKGRIKFLLLFTPRRRVSPGHLRSQPNLKLFLSNLPFIFDKIISPKDLTCAWTGVPSSTLPNYVSKTGCFCKRQFYIEWNSESHFFCLAKMWLYATLLLEVQDCNLVREIWDLVWFLVVLCSWFCSEPWNYAKFTGFGFRYKLASSRALSLSSIFRNLNLCKSSLRRIVL